MSYNYGYNSRGEVVKADSSYAGAAHDTAYQYDAVGNRQKSISGSTNVNDLSATSYAANALNQYDAINNGANVTLAYDLDGNLISGVLPLDEGTGGANGDPLSTLVWNGENRLIKVIKANGDVIDFSYDFQGRRISKETPASTQVFIYDGWNLIAQYLLETDNLKLESSYVWGLDLSGTFQGAGGVGGLLAMTRHAGQADYGIYFPNYDGNGNVTEMRQGANNGQYALRIGYDAFGKEVANTGTMAGAAKSASIPFRFSTKYRDAETGLLYYGYRYYNPATGRWPSRDPIEERGGINLYNFVKNSPIIWFDILGLEKLKADAYVMESDLIWDDIYAHVQLNGDFSCDDDGQVQINSLGSKTLVNEGDDISNPDPDQKARACPGTSGNKGFLITWTVKSENADVAFGWEEGSAAGGAVGGVAGGIIGSGAGVVGAIPGAGAGAGIGGAIGAGAGGIIELFDNEWLWAFRWKWKVCCACVDPKDKSKGYKVVITDLGRDPEDFEANDGEFYDKYE